MAGSDSTLRSLPPHALDALDRIVVVYIMLPVGLFVLGWFKLWIALPLLAAMTVSARALLFPLAPVPQYPLNRMQILLAVLMGGIWVYLSGIGHFVYANTDWYTRDAVLHDLVAAPWPVVYQLPDGTDLLLRAPLGFYAPAAVLGKVFGLPGAHVFLTLWTALGTVLFILQAMTLAPSRFPQALLAALIVIFFSGLDFVGSALNWGPRFFTTYDIASHIEWWAGSYQYSAMTTQLFWVPNHALGAWVLMGLFARSPGVSEFDRLLPMLMVCAAVWSPLSALGILPFAALRLLQHDWRSRLACYLRPTSLLPALLLVALVAAYFTMDTGRIDKGMSIGAQQDGDFISPLLNQLQFFLLEAGFIGMAILAIRPSRQVVVALIVLLLLPLAHLGPGNDLVMRTSIPSLVILVLASSAALFQPDAARQLRTRKRVLATLLVIGSITAVHEFARAFLLPSWPINLRSSVIAVNCGAPPHYTAQMLGQTILTLMPASRPWPVQYEGRQICLNPAWELRTLRDQQRSRRNTP